MQITSINNAFSLKSSKINSIKNLIAFRSNAKSADVFELSDDYKLARYKAQLEKNPNTAFLYDPSLSHVEKIKELNKHPEIKTVGNALKNTHIGADAVMDDLFEFDILTTEYETHGSIKTKETRLIDSTYAKNKESLEMLSNRSEDLYDYASFRKRFKMPVEDFINYLRLGRLEKLNPDTENNTTCPHSRILDITSEKNKKAVLLYRTLNQRSGYLDKLIDAERGEKIYADTQDLKNYGINNEKLIAKLIKKGSIDGKILEDEDNNALTILVNLNDRKTASTLRYIRSKNCVDIEAYSAKYGIPVPELEDAFMDGKLDLLCRPLFMGEFGKPMIDLTSRKNLEYLNNELLHKEIQHEILSNKKTIIRALDSLKMKIAWYLSPQTRNVAHKIAKLNPEIAMILKKKEEIDKEKTAEKSEDENEIQVDENLDYVIPSLSESEEKLLKQYYKGIWKVAGTEEFLAARKKAAEIIQDYQKNGITAIEDSYIKNLIENYQKFGI